MVNLRSTSPGRHRFVTCWNVPLTAVLLLLGAEIPYFAGAQVSQIADSRTPAAVITADNNWDKAIAAGNTAYIEALLLPEYRSISSDGSTDDKAAILASARKSVGSAERAASIAKWHSNHPALTSVQIVGDTAILTFTLNKPSSPKRVMSCDVFVYREGRWRGLYSQHTKAES